MCVTSSRLRATLSVGINKTVIKNDRAWYRFTKWYGPKMVIDWPIETKGSALEINNIN